MVAANCADSSARRRPNSLLPGSSLNFTYVIYAELLFVLETTTHLLFQ